MPHCTVAPQIYSHSIKLLMYRYTTPSQNNYHGIKTMVLVYRYIIPPQHNAHGNKVTDALWHRRSSK
jgi:hypothetical protein